MGVVGAGAGAGAGAWAGAGAGVVLGYGRVLEGCGLILLLGVWEAAPPALVVVLGVELCRHEPLMSTSQLNEEIWRRSLESSFG